VSPKINRRRNDSADHRRHLIGKDAVVSTDLASSPAKVAELLKTATARSKLTAANTYYGGTIVAEGTCCGQNNHALGADTQLDDSLTPSGPYVAVGNRGRSAVHAGDSHQRPRHHQPRHNIQAAARKQLPRWLRQGTSLSERDQRYRSLNQRPRGWRGATLSGTINNVAAAADHQVGRRHGSLP